MWFQRVDGVHDFEYVAVRRDVLDVRVPVVLCADSHVEIAVVVAVHLVHVEYREAVQRLDQLHCLVAVHHWTYLPSRSQLRRRAAVNDRQHAGQNQ